MPDYTLSKADGGSISKERADLIKKDPGLRGLRLYVDKSNERAMKTYEAMGMDGSHYTVYEWMKY